MASEELPVASRQMRTWLSVKPKERSQASRAAKPSGVLARDLVESPLTHTQYDIEFGLSNINTKSSCQHGKHRDRIYSTSCKLRDKVRFTSACSLLAF